MKQNQNRDPLLWLFALVVLVSACEKETYNRSADAKLKFSADTLLFDTIFTDIGSATYELRVLNPYRESLWLDYICLAGGENSPYRLNIDGEPANCLEDIQIAPGDSIFIFAEVTIDPNGADQPFIVKDSIRFSVNGNQQDVDLISFGQNVHLIRGEVLQSAVWDSLRPYLIYSSSMIDTNAVLQIQEGTRIYFHRGVTLYIAGSLQIEGSQQHPVWLKGDRLEAVYEDIPGQWNGLYFVNGSKNNHIYHARIENAVSGIHLGNLYSEDDPPDLHLANSYIQHMNVSGLSSIGASITAENCVISHCGFQCVALYGGGSYRFTHCTLANRWEYNNRTTPALLISDYFEYEGNVFLGFLQEASFRNTIISGSRDSEVGLVLAQQYAELPYLFDHSLLRFDPEQAGFQLEEEHTVFYVSGPLFKDEYSYNFIPDSLSRARNIASTQIAAELPVDLKGNSRFADEGPDIGALEWKSNGQ